MSPKPRNNTAFAYRDSSLATFESPVLLADALRVVQSGRRLLKCYDRDGAHEESPPNKAFGAFHRALYGAGMVMSDFNGPHFSHGPIFFFFMQGLGGLLARSSNLSTLRMFLHTLARGYHVNAGGIRLPYFDHAYRSGSLQAIIDRLEQFCDLARARQWQHLQDDLELDLIRPDAP